MTDYAKKIVEIQRITQQSFLMIEEYSNPRTLLSRKRAGLSLEFQLERAIEGLTSEIAELKKVKLTNDAQAEVFWNEVASLEKSSDRLNGILRLINVTKSLRSMHGEEASLLISKAEQEFDSLRERHPFTKDDIEARSTHIVHCLFLAVVTDIQPIDPFASVKSYPIKRVPEATTRISKSCLEAEVTARNIIDTPTSSLHVAGEIAQHELFSTEKCMEELHIDKGACSWMASLKLEKCKISNRARKVLKCLIELINLAPQNQENHCLSRSISTILQLFIVRAQPQVHSGVDAAIFFNDCHFIIIELKRAKFEQIYPLPNPTEAFNFGNLLNAMRKTARNVLIKDIVHVKTNYLTWPETALEDYLANKDNKFNAVLAHLKRFSKLWTDVCSKNTYAYTMFLVCSHILSLLIDTLLKLKDFDRSTCSKVLPLVNDVVQACTEHIRACEAMLKKKFTEVNMGKNLLKKVGGLKTEMINRKADRSLAELFDFKLEV